MSSKAGMLSVLPYIYRFEATFCRAQCEKAQALQLDCNTPSKNCKWLKVVLLFYLRSLSLNATHASDAVKSCLHWYIKNSQSDYFLLLQNANQGQFFFLRLFPDACTRRLYAYRSRENKVTNPRGK